jgi:phosphoribosylformylglycinamidine (FGAM) synthase-like amidotransferase family enzyme
VIPIKHGEGNWYGDCRPARALEVNGRSRSATPRIVNGPLDRDRGVTNEAGNVLGLMPHPSMQSTRSRPDRRRSRARGLIAAARERAGAVA